MKYLIYLPFFCLVFCSLRVKAQKPTGQDTSYVSSYENQLTTRFYFSQKSTTLQISDDKGGYTLNYRPNTTLNMGVGATYKWATLNLAYGFGFLNPDNGQGKTKYLDLQFHRYGKKVVIDVFGQFYRGFFLNPKGYAADREAYYVRPDLRNNQVGISAQYIFNWKEFSYRAAFFQNEWQKKSSGTFLLGAELYHGWVKADSTIIPHAVDAELANDKLERILFTDGGINAGYAHTFVIKRHFFLTGSAAASIGYNGSKWNYSNYNLRGSGVTPNVFYRVFAGYNSTRWAASVVYQSNRVRLAPNEEAQRLRQNTSNYRLNIVYRLRPSRKVKKILKPVDRVEEVIE